MGVVAVVSTKGVSKAHENGLIRAKTEEKKTSLKAKTIEERLADPDGLNQIKKMVKKQYLKLDKENRGSIPLDQFKTACEDVTFVLGLSEPTDAQINETLKRFKSKDVRVKNDDFETLLIEFLKKYYAKSQLSDESTA